MVSNKYISNFLILIFSFFLGFGKFDPFGTGGMYFNFLTILVILNILFFTNILSQIRLYRKTLILLFAIFILFLISGLLYGLTYVEVDLFNLKYIAAIIIFWFFSFVFQNNYKLCIYSIMVFSLSCALIAVLYNIGLLNSFSEVRNGRLLIFEENPNSISSRMAIAFIVIVYLIIENPLNFKLFRFSLILVLPSVFYFIVATGSRGSFLALLLGLALIVLFSNIPKITKIFLVVLSFFGFISIFNFIEGTSLLERFNAADVSGGREKIWSNAIEIFYDFPWGVGQGGYITEMIKRYSMTNDTHNLFIYLLVCGGWLALLIFLVFLKDLLIIVLKNLKTGNTLLIVIFVFLVFLMSKTGGILTYLIMWYFFAVINSFDIKIKSHLKNNQNVLV